MSPIANICPVLLIILIGGLSIEKACAQEATTSENTKALVQPPPVPDRSALPVLSEETLPPPKGTGIPKPSLAWRAGVYRKTKLSATGISMPALAPPIQQRFYSDPRATAKRVYLSSRDDAFFALLSTCPMKGFTVLFMDSLGGRLVAGINASIISFSVRSLPGNRTGIEANVERGDRQALNGLLDDLLLSTGSALSHGGSF